VPFVVHPFALIHSTPPFRPFLPPHSVPNLQISFIGLHWNRDTPFWGDQGEHIEETVWEQIDNGVPWTATRKFLIIVPVVLFMVSAHVSLYQPIHLAINLAVLAILLVAKLPELHGVRILGINKARDVD
jgi:hypothetical protein